ncbi:glycosyltransferase family A protein [Candidatus Nitrososphaera gargensis]|nr:glycosyltransferase family A protein [Candidatus Nitrososphaera gargensis]
MSYKSPRYWALVTVKNGEMTIVESLESIMRQSVEPSLVCVVNDGSTDSTSNLLFKLKDSYQNIHIITLEDKGYDSRRIVHNWNIACDYVKKSGKEYDYLLISSDDVVLPKEYVERLIQEMSIDPKLAVVSGNRGLAQSDFISLPEGAGRLIRVSFFSQIGYRHPPYYGYEPWILYKALQMGYRIRKLADLKYEHKRTFGVGHQFIEYGPAMRCLGYHPIFVLARVVRNILTNKTGISKSASLRMLFDYLFEGKWKDDPYFQYFDPELREFIRNLQKQRLFRKLTMI